MERRRGFTMIEAVVIIVVLASLAGILAPMVIREVAKANLARAENDMAAISTAFTQFYVDTGFWPERYHGHSDERAELIVLTCLYEDPGDLPGWDGPHLERGVMVANSFQVAYAGEGGGCGGEPQTRYTGLIDPWGTPFFVMYGRVGSRSAGAGGAIVFLSAGPNRGLNTEFHNAVLGEAGDDDILRIVTRRVPKVLDP